VAFDVSTLPTTSSKRAFRWRDPGTALVLVREGGKIRHAGRLEEKRALLADVGDSDCVLAIRRGRFSPDVLWVDDLAEARSALE
jgi:hypothetical protein